MTHTQSAAHLAVDGVSFSYAGRRVLSNISFTIPAGDRTALIGENGSGKSTLLRIIAGVQAPDAGIVLATAPGGHPPRIGLLHQEYGFLANGTIQDAVEAAVSPLRRAAAAVAETAALMGQAFAAGAADREYTDALAAAEHVGAWEVEARVERMLAGLGLGDFARDTKTGTLSGGQLARLGLAQLLLSAPEVLLLDEPTNHLDAGATQ